MKKILLLGIAAAFACALCACTAQEAPEPDGGEVGMENPWSEAASAQEAAENAGIGSFEVADNLGLPPVYPLGEPAYQSMSGVAEAAYQLDGCTVVVRKGNVSGQALSGDYTVYPEAWKEVVDGITVTCMGYEIDSASNLSWETDTGFVSVVFYSEGGENVGLTSEQIPALVESIK